jgi:ribonuclease HI
MAKKKFYVVWQGHEPGIYSDWEICKQQIKNYPNAKYKSFEKKEEAEVAFKRGSNDYISYNRNKNIPRPSSPSHRPNPESLSVDAACSGNPGMMEYRGVYTRTGQEIFRIGPYEEGTNNIGEFLALVHGLALLKQQKSPIPIYSDSATAISWIRQKKCKTKLLETNKNVPIFDLIERAERWLNENIYDTTILKWDTAAWGEIPADFGRK